MNNLSLYNSELIKRYKSNSQIARVLSENWFSSEMYCPCCLNLKLHTCPNNEKARDFFCDKCKNDFQLKSSSKKFSRKVVDGEFKTMMEFISNNLTPNLFLMHYSNEDWFIKNLSAIPRFFISASIIEKRNISFPKGRTNGWVGCNFLLDRISEDGIIPIIKNEKVIDKEIINKKWKKMFFLNAKNPFSRGWTTDVLKCIEDISNKEFTLQDIYNFKDYLKELHPKNTHIEAKIRQQLQILRDNNILKFEARGRYALK